MEGWSGDNGTWVSTTTSYPGTYGVAGQTPKPVDPIETAADDVLIFELIKRGYAVAKMPAEELAKAAE